MLHARHCALAAVPLLCVLGGPTSAAAIDTTAVLRIGGILFPYGASQAVLPETVIQASLISELSAGMRAWSDAIPRPLGGVDTYVLDWTANFPFVVELFRYGEPSPPSLRPYAQLAPAAYFAAPWTDRVMIVDGGLLSSPFQASVGCDQTTFVCQDFVVRPDVVPLPPSALLLAGGLMALRRRALWPERSRSCAAGVWADRRVSVRTQARAELAASLLGMLILWSSGLAANGGPSDCFRKSGRKKRDRRLRGLFRPLINTVDLLPRTGSPGADTRYCRTADRSVRRS